MHSSEDKKNFYIPTGGLNDNSSAGQANAVNHNDQAAGNNPQQPYPDQDNNFTNQSNQPQPVTEETSQVKAKKPLYRLLLTWLFRFCVLALIAALVFCVWNRWFRYDDAADIQGTWKVGTSLNAIVIDGKTITLQKNAVFDYTLDTNSKMISYSLGNMSGRAHYRFGPDRALMAICENQGDNVFSTAWYDACWFFDSLKKYSEGEILTPANTILGETNPESEKSLSLSEVIENGAETSILLTRANTSS